MQEFIIVGAGGYGREVCAFLPTCLGYGTEFVFKGFLDSNPSALVQFPGYGRILGSIDSYRLTTRDVFFVALGSIPARIACVKKLIARGAKFRTLIHRTASIAAGVEIGEGCFIAQFVMLSTQVKVGRHASIFQHAVLGHDVEIGNFTHVYAQCTLGGGVHLEEGAVVYPGAHIVPRRRIGRFAVVGTGASVLLDVKANQTVFGNPAAPLHI